MDYQEVNFKRSGKRVVFCKLQDIICADLGIENEDQIPEKAKLVGTKGEYVCHCPFCKAEGHKKPKLYIRADFSSGHCFVCDRAFIQTTDSIVTDYRVPTFITPQTKLELIKLNDPNWSLDRYYQDFDDTDDEGIRYLMGRHPYMAALWKLLRFKFIEGAVVMPFFYKNDLFYYQLRFTAPNSKIRYYFPPIESGRKPPYIIEHGDLKNPKVIICEGVYDAISLLVQAPSYIPFAVLGSSITDYQIEFLREYVPSEVAVYMDDTEKSKTIARRIRGRIDYCPIHIIRSDGTDPEEKMKEKMKRRPGSEIGWIDRIHFTEEPKLPELNERLFI